MLLTMTDTPSDSHEDRLKLETKNGKALKEVEYEPTYSKYFAPPDIRPEKVFSEVIQRDKSLCSNCYHSRWDYEAIEFRCGELGWLLWERRYPIPGRNYPDPLRDQRHDGSPICCNSCGFESGQRKGELPTHEALDYTCNISRALFERGHAHDPEILLRAVKRNKSISEIQGQRGEIFGSAVTEAIRYARHRKQMAESKTRRAHAD